MSKTFGFSTVSSSFDNIIYVMLMFVCFIYIYTYIYIYIYISFFRFSFAASLIIIFKYKFSNLKYIFYRHFLCNIFYIQNIYHYDKSLIFHVLPKINIIQNLHVMVTKFFRRYSIRDNIIKNFIYRTKFLSHIFLTHFFFFYDYHQNL